MTRRILVGASCRKPGSRTLQSGLTLPLGLKAKKPPWTALVLSLQTLFKRPREREGPPRTSAFPTHLAATSCSSLSFIPYNNPATSYVSLQHPPANRLLSFSLLFTHWSPNGWSPLGTTRLPLFLFPVPQMSLVPAILNPLPTFHLLHFSHYCPSMSAERLQKSGNGRGGLSSSSTQNPLLLFHS